MATDQQDNLPYPTDRPESDVVIYDGQCRFCRSQVKRLNRWDWRKRLSFVSLHDPLVAERYPNLTHDQLMAEMTVVTSDGQQFGGAASIQYLARRLPPLYLAYPFLNFPFTLPLWSWIYRAIAKRRYKLAGRDCENGSCQIHFDKH